MKSIIVFNHKGGSSRTTTSLNLYHGLIKAGAKCCIIDTDPQLSLTNINKVIGAKVSIVSSLKEGAAMHNYCIIDTPPYYSPLTLPYIQNATLVLMPVRASALDVVATIQTFNDIKKHNQNIFAFFTSVKMGIKFPELVSQLHKYKIPLLDTIVHNRIVFSKMMQTTGNIYSTQDVQAKNEITDLITEIHTKI